MHYSRLSIAGFIATSLTGAFAQNSNPIPSGAPTPQEGDVMMHVVQVGDAEGMKKFYPEKITAQPGELVQFQFYPSEHSIAQSTFDKPCEPIENSNSSAAGFWSGFMPVTRESTEMPLFTILVNDTNPIWFYCATAKHCQGGMVGVINEPAGRTLEAYKETALLVEKTGIPASAASGGTNSTGGAGDMDEGIPSNSSNSGTSNPPGGAGATPASPSGPASPPDADANSDNSGSSSLHSSSPLSILMVAVALGLWAL